jgi:hypothetical protein
LEKNFSKLGEDRPWVRKRQPAADMRGGPAVAAAAEAMASRFRKDRRDKPEKTEFKTLSYWPKL